MKNTKKWLKLSLAIVLVLTFMISVTSCAGPAAASEAKDDNGEFDDIEWTYDADDKELVINGSGDISDFDVAEVPWKAAKKSIERIKISSGITSIGDNAFAFCSKLESVTVPSTVTYIGESAFEACNKLEAIEIPAAVTEIGARAFAHCSSLKEVIILGNISTIESWTFKGCSALEALTVYSPDGNAPTVADDAFLECAIDGLDDDGVELKTTNTTAVDITVTYVYENGDEAADTVVETKNKGESYEIESPKIEGYEADKTTVSGTVTSLLSINEKVTYKEVAVEEESAETEAETEPVEDKGVQAGTVITIIVFVVVVAALVVFAIFMFRPDKKVTGKNDKNKKK